MSGLLSPRNLLAAGGVAAVVAVGAFVTTGGFARRATGIDVEVAEATIGDLRRVVATSGSVRALVTVEVGSQLSGQIASLDADFNTTVKENDVLARLDPQTYETRIREAEASVVVAQSQVQVQEANLARAQANLRRLESEYSRAEDLLARGTTSQSAYDQALANVEGARADVQVAEAGLTNAQATLGQRQASLDSARIDLDRTIIRSPIDGIVVSREVDVGQTVAASMQAPILFTIAEDLTRVQIDAQVDEADIGQVEEGQNVSFTVDAYPDIDFQGLVDQIRLAATNEQNVVTYTVVISANNPGRRLLPGMTANLDIITGFRQNVLMVDNRGLRFEPRGEAETLLTSEGHDVLAELREDDEQDAFPRGFPPGGFPGGPGGFRPPGGGNNGGFNRNGGEGGPPGGSMVAEIRDELELTDDQVEQIETAMRANFASIRSSFSEGGEPPDFDAIRGRMRSSIEAVLTPEQQEKFEALDLMSGGRRQSVVVWVQTEGGQFEPRRVVLGVSDGGSTEIVSGDLKEGDRVVVRARERTA